MLLFEYPANVALEIHLPQRTRNCLDMDWYSNLIFAEETTSFVAFIHYEQSSPILCHDTQFTCISANDDFSAIMNCQCLNYCETNICNMHVVLLGILHSKPISQLPYSESSFGPCGNKLDGRCFGIPQKLYKVIDAIRKNLLVNSSPIQNVAVTLTKLFGTAIVKIILCNVQTIIVIGGACLIIKDGFVVLICFNTFGSAHHDTLRPIEEVLYARPFNNSANIHTLI